MTAQQNILSSLIRSVVEFKVDECREAAHKAIEAGIDPKVAIMEGLAKGMARVGVLYDTMQYFVPEVLLSAEALYAGLEIIRPHVGKEPKPKKATIVMGTVLGDTHNIGKNIVKLMFDAAGWEVHDLGHDVPLENFKHKVIEVDADILAMSAMMTTTMMEMKKVISMVRATGHDCLIMVGGAPVTREIADILGADGYAPSAGTAVSEALNIIARSTRSHPLKPTPPSAYGLNTGTVQKMRSV